MGDSRDMLKRASLSHIANYVQNGGDLLEGCSSGLDIEGGKEKAYDEMVRSLTLEIGPDKIKEVLPIIERYAAANGDINFALGMRAGAKVVIDLIGDQVNS